MRRILFLVAVLLCALPTFAQNMRVDDIAFKGTNPTQFAPGATITVCTSAGSGLPCTPKVSGLCSSASDAVCNQPDPTTSDSVGNFGFWIQPGTYVVTITGSGLSGYSKTWTLSCPLNGNCAFTNVGALAPAFPFIANSGAYAGCTTAQTAAGAVNPAIIILPASGPGIDCNATSTKNLMYENFDPTRNWGNTSTATGDWFAVNWNYDDGNVRSGQRHNLTTSTINNSGAIVADFFLTTLKNAPASPVGNTVDGLSAQCQIGGTLGFVLANCQGHEQVADVFSTGNSVTWATGGIGYAQTDAGGTTTVTNGAGYRALGVRSAAGGAFTNAYGLYASAQSLGTTRNYSIAAEGKSLLVCVSTTCGIDAEDQSHVTHPLLYIDPTNAVNFQSIAAASGANGAMYFNKVNGSTALRISDTAAVFFIPPVPNTAANWDIGSAALPWANLWLGTAATNNFKFQPAATAAARVISMPDPLGAVNMPYVIASGTTTLTANAALAAVTSQAANTTAATGTLTTDSIEWSFATAPTAGDNLCHVLTYVTAGNVNFVRTNPTAAAQNVSALVINWRVIR